MKKFLLSSAKMVAIVVLSSMLASFVVVATENASNGGNITVVASVAPARYIIVDNDLQIIRILSNTEEEVRPSVLLYSADGAEVPFSETIQAQYAKLKPGIDFSQPGEVYKSEQPPVVNILNSIAAFFRNLFSGF